MQKFDANGTFLTKWGGQGLTDGKFVAPIGIAVDGAGNVYVADRSGSMNVQKFDEAELPDEVGNLRQRRRPVLVPDRRGRRRKR